MHTPETVSALPAEFLLNVQKYTALFSRDAKTSAKIYRKLTAKWHPDRHEEKTKLQAEKVFALISTLYEQAKFAISKDCWGRKEFLIQTSAEADRFFQYFDSNEVPGFGHQYVGSTAVCYEVFEAAKDLVPVWQSNARRFQDATKKEPRWIKDFADQVIAYPNSLPSVVGTVLRVNKGSKFLNLKHCLAVKPLPPVHVAWIISRLINLACMMETSDCPNLSISTSSIFINPAEHTAFIADGWQYLSSFSEEVEFIPASTLSLCPGIAKTRKFLPKHLVAQIRAVAKECLGDPNGVMMLTRTDIPASFGMWLNSPSEAIPTLEFFNWDRTKKIAFGPPKFIELNLTEGDIY